jgi:superoxide dismutase
MHAVPDLNPSFQANGIPGLLSKEGFNVAWTQYQALVVDKLNVLTAGTFSWLTTGQACCSCADVSSRYGTWLTWARRDGLGAQGRQDNRNQLFARSCPRTTLQLCLDGAQ